MMSCICGHVRPHTISAFGLDWVVNYIIRIAINEDRPFKSRNRSSDAKAISGQSEGSLPHP